MLITCIIMQTWNHIIKKYILTLSFNNIGSPLLSKGRSNWKTTNSALTIFFSLLVVLCKCACEVKGESVYK